MTSDDEPAAANNVAGRVLAFLREFQATSNEMPNDAMSVLAKMIDAQMESSRIYLTTLRVQVQAEAVPRLMAPYERLPGYTSFVENYPEVLITVGQLNYPGESKATDILKFMGKAGWSALEYANEVLSDHIGEPSLTGAQVTDYLTQVQEIINAVAGDESLAPRDRARLVDLLQKVEQALLDVRIYGALPVQEAAAAAVAGVLSLRDRIGSMPWYQRLGYLMVGICAAADLTGNVIVIQQAFADEPQKVVVIESRVEDKRQSAEPNEEVKTPPGR